VSGEQGLMGSADIGPPLEMLGGMAEDDAAAAEDDEFCIFDKWLCS